MGEMITRVFLYCQNAPSKLGGGEWSEPVAPQGDALVQVANNPGP